MKKKHNLSKKLILMLIGAVVAVMAVATVCSSLTFFVKNEDTRLGLLYIMGLAAVIVILVLFAYIINRMIVRRVQVLSKAVSAISQGKYDLTVPVQGNDELTELSENFNKMAAELQANAFLSKDFARYVSHEFKTPLSVIRSYAEAIQINSADSETSEYTQIIISETDRLAEMSKTILELCRLDSTTLVEKKDTFSPAEQIRSVILSNQLSWGAKHIAVLPDLDEFQVIGNEALTFRIWQNLIGNAIKFTEADGRIEVTLKKQGNNMQFTVADNGIGIAEEDKEKVYDLFFTGDRSRNKEGSGLGLPLTRAIVEKLGGTITFTSARGEGTAFTVILPL